MIAREEGDPSQIFPFEGERRDTSLYILNWKDATSRTFDGNQFIYLKYGRHK